MDCLCSSVWVCGKIYKMNWLQSHSTLQIEPTRSCNLNCKICIRRNLGKANSQLLKEESSLSCTLNYSRKESGSPGIRGRRHSEYDWALNPQVSLTYQVAKGNVKLSVNKATTIPTFYERYCKSNFREGNPELSEGKAINYNVGLGYKCNEFLDIGIAFFLADIDDFITSVEGEDLVWRYVNVESASRKGVELESKMSLFHLRESHIVWKD